MSNSLDHDLPIAQRRVTRRCVSAAAAAAKTTTQLPVSCLSSQAPKTPSKTRPKKRVRFSDPGPETSHYEDELGSGSTGLTPMVSRSSLGESTAKRPRRSCATYKSISVGNISEEATPRQGSVETKRKRPKSAATARIEAEIERLRAELADRDAEIERLHKETLVQDTDRVLELEQQVEALRAELAQQQQLPAQSIENEYDDEDENETADVALDSSMLSRSFYDWTLAARDPFSDSYLDGDGDGGSDDTFMADIACSTPTRKRNSTGAVIGPKSASASFPTPPCTSPMIPLTPFSARRGITPLTLTPSHAHVGVQVALPDPEKQELLEELASLRLEQDKLKTALDAYTALQMRLSEKLASAAPLDYDSENDNEAQETETEQPNSSSSSNPLDLESHLDLVLDHLTTQSSLLYDLSASLHTLSFSSAESSSLISLITSGLRSARLELSLPACPPDSHDLSFPLLSHGAAVLDLLLTQVLDLTRKTRSQESSIDEYHAQEFSLRQQLSARVDAMRNMRQDAARNSDLLAEAERTIRDLETGLSRLKRASEGYRSDIAELEALVTRVEAEGAEATSLLQMEVSVAVAELRSSSTIIQDLENKLTSSRAEVEDLDKKLRDALRKKDAEASVRNKSYGAALALRDTRVHELRKKIYAMNESLGKANEALAKLKLENRALTRSMVGAEEREMNAKDALEVVKRELEKVTAAAAKTQAEEGESAPKRRKTRSSSAIGLATPEPQAGAFLSGDFARSSGTGKGKGKGKRKYDSGLGLLDEDEDEGEDEDEDELVV
ncbi:hypothetical protein F4777DRAFT_564510 [Nemania sp. FL0916]|nr:hypothetical protein F4777DRAFT_564510 [Nemania sp. FL0916]